MKAAVNDRYGPPGVVWVADVPRPVPKAGQVLVRVNAAAVTSGDARLRAARFPAGFAPFARPALGVFRPRKKILGSAYAGVVEAVGPAVTRLRPGDRVCGMAGMAMGAHAEYLAVSAEKVAATPDGVSDDDAAGLLFGGTTALFFLRDKAGMGGDGDGARRTVLVNGASGAVGTNAVQLARHFGASVTGVTSGANAELVTRLGAGRVIDHTRHDVTRTTDRFDVVLDTVGTLSIKAGRSLLTADGVLLLAVGTLADTVRARGNVVAGVAPERRADYELLLGLVADGTLTVVIDQVYDLADAAEAHARVDTGHKVGNVLLHP